MADLEPASALAERIYDSITTRELDGSERFVPLVSALIESDRAAVREAMLREAIAVVERWTWETVGPEYGLDTGKRRTLAELEKLLGKKRTELEKLLTEKRTHG